MVTFQPLGVLGTSIRNQSLFTVTPMTDFHNITCTQSGELSC